MVELASTAVARVNGTAAGVSVAAGRKGFTAELDGLRERMRGLGFGYDEIAGELARRYRMRPREAYRLAYGWTLNHAAARFNAQAAKENADPQARASLTGARLCEFEKWPDSERKPSVYVLLMLARIYETDVLCLLDLADHERIAPQDRIVLLSRQPATISDAREEAGISGVGFSAELRRLMEARGWSGNELARRVPCDRAYISRLVNGRQIPSASIAARLDEEVGASGVLIESASLLRRSVRRQPPSHSAFLDVINDAGNPRGHARVTFTANPRGISLSLPYVPGRVVIEISGPDTEAESGHGLSLVTSRPTRGA